MRRGHDRNDRRSVYHGLLPLSFLPLLVGAAPVGAATLWRESEVKITSGAENLAALPKAIKAIGNSAELCGGHVMSRHPHGGFVDVYAATIPDLQFVPTHHVHYGEAVLPIRDGLPKFNDLPTAYGGSGEMVLEIECKSERRGAMQIVDSQIHLWENAKMCRNTGRSRPIRSTTR